MAIPVVVTSKASFDMLTIFEFEKMVNGAPKAREIIKTLTMEAKSPGAFL